jgi:hydroxymethylbilane synthase
MHRVNLSHRITSLISSPQLYHAVGQGALAVEIRKGDSRTRDVLRSLGHWQTEWRVGCERGCMRVLEGGCSVPVGVETELIEIEQGEDEDSPEWTQTAPKLTVTSPTLHFSGLLAPSTKYPSPTSTSLPPLTKRRAKLTIKTCITSLDGKRQIIHAPPPVLVKSYAEAERWGEICAETITEMGGGPILAEINVIRKERERLDIERAKAMSLSMAAGSNESNGSNGNSNGVGAEAGAA